MVNLYDLLTKPAPGTIMTWRTSLSRQNVPSSGPILIFTGTKALQLAVSNAMVNTFAPYRPFDNKKINDATAAYFLRGKLGGVAKVDVPHGDLSVLQFTGTMFGEESEERKDVASWNDLRWGKYLEIFKSCKKLLYRASNLHSASRVATLLYFPCGRVLQTSAPVEGAVLRYNFAPVLHSSCDILVSTTYRPLVTYACQYLVARWVFPSKAKLTLTSGVKRAFLFGFGVVFYSAKCSENLCSLYHFDYLNPETGTAIRSTHRSMPIRVQRLP
ncbi:hypothetical protein EV421DRAFT_1741633 [Armillaria borealis]|uniref:Uncharacterized protein n=1 Tax=Armillaria borealis TaxID=47425 RepID=A0AA39MFV4_9AGAR|nr:hypothetical protein EV421DRAFT_1741633 [Armillaria borealis]